MPSRLVRRGVALVAALVSVVAPAPVRAADARVVVLDLEASYGWPVGVVPSAQPSRPFYLNGKATFADPARGVYDTGCSLLGTDIGSIPFSAGTVSGYCGPLYFSSCTYFRVAVDVTVTCPTLSPATTFSGKFVVDARNASPDPLWWYRGRWVGEMTYAAQ